jgi:hypothetical protein
MIRRPILAVVGAFLALASSLSAQPYVRGYVRDIEALLRGLDTDVSEGAGSRVRVALSGVEAIFHRPHLQKETDKSLWMSILTGARSAERTLKSPTSSSFTVRLTTDLHRAAAAAAAREHTSLNAWVADQIRHATAA